MRGFAGLGIAPIGALAAACAPSREGVATPPDAEPPVAAPELHPRPACVPLSWRPDRDGDGYGDATATVRACERPDGWILDGTDCDDADPAANPAGLEICGTEADEDCDGAATPCRYEADGWLEDAGDRVRGTEAYYQVGVGVSWAGDVNGDGRDDVVAMGGWVSVGGAMAGGPIYVFTEPPGKRIHAEYADAVLYSSDLEPDYGIHGMDGVGDVDGDGANDVAITRRDGVCVLTRIEPGWHDYAGGCAAELPGWNVGHAGDVTGDGVHDLLVYGSSDEGWGEVRVFAGPLAGPYTDEDAAMTLEDTASRGYASLGDTEGDGAPSFVLADYQDSTTGRYTGVVRIYHDPVPGFNGVESAIATYYGAEEEQWAGWVTRAAGDVNGDGYSDVLVASFPKSMESYGIEVRTAASLLLGPVAGTWSLTDAEARFECADPWWCTGPEPSAAGDLDADGTGDFAIAFPIANYDEWYSQGAVTLWYGPVEGTLDPKLDADAIRYGSHYAVTGREAIDVAGDIDGDGRSDLIVGSYDWRESEGAPYAQGAFYLLYGGAL